MVIDVLEGPGVFHIRHARTEEAWQVCTFSGHAEESLVLNQDFNIRLHSRGRDEVHTPAVLFKPVMVVPTMLSKDIKKGYMRKLAFRCSARLRSGEEKAFRVSLLL